MRTAWFVAVLIAVVSLTLLAGCPPADNAPKTSAPDPGPVASAPQGVTPAALPGQEKLALGGTTVTIKDFSFHPATLSVTAGTEVTWTNQDGAEHTVTGEGWGSGQIAPGQSYSYTFASPGTFAYHCSPHPKMQGTVNVAAARAH